MKLACMDVGIHMHNFKLLRLKCLVNTECLTEDHYKKKKHVKAQTPL